MDSFAFLVALDDLDKFSFDGHVGETVGPIVNYNGSRLLIFGGRGWKYIFLVVDSVKDGLKVIHVDIIRDWNTIGGALSHVRFALSVRDFNRPILSDDAANPVLLIGRLLALKTVVGRQF